jgi:carbamoyl-phosphate synthase large subunit
VAKKFNVLVFPGGTEVGLEIHSALSLCKEIQLFSAGLNVPNHAPYVFSHHAIIPNICRSGWIDRLNDLTCKWEIDFIFPAYDDVLVALVENADRIKARIISSPLRTCQVTRSKSETYRALAGIVPVPQLYETADEISSYPVFLKPDRGQGSQDIHLVCDRRQLDLLLTTRLDSIILEWLPGAEYTIDCFSDRETGLQFCQGRERVRTKSGISMSSRDIHDPLFVEYGEAISRKLPMYGAWFFQLRKDGNHQYKLLEVAPRIAGTMALHRVKGVNFPLLSIYEHLRMPVEVAPLNIDVEIDRALVNRYRSSLRYKTVYVDLDDTLILNGAVNIKLVSFLYQCLNKGCRTVLVTRHDLDVDQTLTKYRLRQIFDQVIYVPQPKSKAESVTEQEAIFIDDSFSERKAVTETRGIPAFDCSMLELLIDERL